jgi:hypothetical protein
MKLFFNVLFCLFVLPLGVFCQEKVQKFMIGPNGDQTRIVLSFVEMSENDFKMQSMIIDLDAIKDKNEKPKSVTVDLTSTVRSIGAGLKKNRKVLLIRWNKNEEIEMKCDDTWTKKDSDSAAQKIIETTKTIIQNIPLNTKETTDITFSDEVVKKVEAVLDSMKPVNFSCLRTLN